MLRLLEPYDLASMGHNSAAYLHHLIEAKKLAYADLEHFVGDPEFMAIEPEQLLAGRGCQAVDQVGNFEDFCGVVDTVQYLVWLRTSRVLLFGLWPATLTSLTCLRLLSEIRFLATAG